MNIKTLESITRVHDGLTHEQQTTRAVRAHYDSLEVLRRLLEALADVGREVARILVLPPPGVLALGVVHVAQIVQRTRLANLRRIKTKHVAHVIRRTCFAYRQYILMIPRRI